MIMIMCNGEDKEALYMNSFVTATLDTVKFVGTKTYLVSRLKLHS